MKRKLFIGILVVVFLASVASANPWCKPKPVKCETLTAIQGGCLSSGNIAIGPYKGWCPAITTSSVGGVVERSAEASGKSGYAGTGSTTIFQQNASAGKGGMAANEVSQESGGGAKVDKNGVAAGTGSSTNMSSIAAGNATASQSLASMNTAVAIGKGGVAVTGEVIGVVMINTAIGGGMASSGVNIAGLEIATVK